MKTLAIAGLCAGLAAAPLVAKAAQLVLLDASGHPIAVLVPMVEPSSFLEQGMGLQPVGFPVAGIFAQQEALLRRMMGDMQPLPTMTIPATSAPGVTSESTVMVSSVRDGQVRCSRTVSYQTRPGGAPLVNVSQTGDGCGALPMATPQTTTPVAAPMPERAVPTPGGPKLYQIDYRHPATAQPLHRG